MRFNLSTLKIVLYSAFIEIKLFILFANIKLSFIFVIFDSILNINKYIYLTNKYRNFFYSYFFIIFFILTNDIIMGVSIQEILSSILLHIISFLIFIFFLKYFLVDINNIIKFFFIYSISLFVYKNGEFFVDFNLLRNSFAYFNPRLAAIGMYLIICLSYYLILNTRIFLSCFCLILYSCLALYFDSRSTSSILFLTIFLFVYFNLSSSKKLRLFYILIVIIIISLFIIKSFYVQFIIYIVEARLNTFVSIVNFYNNFPFGIGSGSTYNNYNSIYILENFFNIELNKYNLIDSEEYSTSHSLIFESLNRNGLFATIPIIFLFYKFYNMSIKTLIFTRLPKNLQLLISFLLSYNTFYIFFSGYGQLLSLTPILLASSIVIYEKTFEK